MNVESLKDVDCVQVFSQIVPLQTGLSLPQGRGVDEVLEVGVVEALLRPERDLPLDLLSQTNKQTLVFTSF
jgi:hypothetical protein